METLQSLIESDHSVQKVVEMVLPLTAQERPQYNGSQVIKVRVDYARDMQWGGVVTVDGRDIQIRGRYGTQKLVPGLIVPAGIRKGEWEWNTVKETTGTEYRNSLNEQTASPFQLKQFVDSIVEEYILLDKMVFDKECSPEMWEQAWVARQALGWIVDRETSSNPSQSILNQSVPKASNDMGLSMERGKNGWSRGEV